jgi:hypothetical protein
MWTKFIEEDFIEEMELQLEIFFKRQDWPGASGSCL